MAETTTTARKKTRRAKRRSVVKHKPGPGYDGQRELRAGLVPDPEKPKHNRVVTINERESSITTMIARKQISGPQGRAAERFAGLYYGLNAASSQALDPSRPVVDTSGRSSAIPDSVLEAGFAMADCARLLGMTEFAVVTLVAGDGLRVKDAAFRLTGRSDPPVVTATGKTLKSGLQKLAVYWGLVGGSAAQQQLSEWLSFTGPKGVIHSREKISALVSGIDDGDR